MKRLLILAILPIAGCATIIDGHTQQITINTNPPGADCTLTRNGEVIGEIPKTPGSVVIEKTKYDMTISCSKKGFETGSYFNHSGTNIDTFGDAVLSGFIGWGVDSATGSDNKYDSPVNMTLNKK